MAAPNWLSTAHGDWSQPGECVGTFERKGIPFEVGKKYWARHNACHSQTVGELIYPGEKEINESLLCVDTTEHSAYSHVSTFRSQSGHHLTFEVDTDILWKYTSKLVKYDDTELDSLVRWNYKILPDSVAEAYYFDGEEEEISGDPLRWWESAIEASADPQSPQPAPPPGVTTPPGHIGWWVMISNTRLKQFWFRNPEAKKWWVNHPIDLSLHAIDCEDADWSSIQAPHNAAQKWLRRALSVGVSPSPITTKDFIKWKWSALYYNCEEEPPADWITGGPWTDIIKPWRRVERRRKVFQWTMMHQNTSADRKSV